MHEIFKNKKTIKRDLLEKIICFEKYRRMYYEMQTAYAGLNSESDLFDMSIGLSVNKSKEKLKYLEANKSYGQIKISQQETCIDPDTEMKIEIIA